jgi:hypothetical protein
LKRSSPLCRSDRIKGGVFNVLQPASNRFLAEAAVAVEHERALFQTTLRIISFRVF